ncbi:penicillin-insensitive murein endopeptidase [Actinokineospora sp.]|uniref:penicillin-insensitive murein endopeptidase n=1 Tax=Actinokineospora sp. TaxID=1872133 RepID=UPI004037817F
MRIRLGLVLVAVAAMATTLITPAHAFAGAFFPTQSAGNRGTDVLAMQYLLQHHGRQVTADGIFGSGSAAAVRDFQQAKGLAADGVVGPGTWGALVVTISQGASGPAVRALQVELNAKRRTSSAVTGTFDSGTRSAVIAFQQHAGIGADGIVGPTTWRNLLWHYDYPDFAAGLCDQNPDGNGTAGNWGTAAAVGQVEAAARQYASTGNGRIPLGDIGFEHGGDIPGHGSHEVGLDVDLWPIRTDSAQCTASRITWQSSTYDRAATRALVQAIRSTAPGHVKLVFFNDPVLISEGLTTQYPNHDNHLHVRYCENVHPNSLYDC